MPIPWLTILQSVPWTDVIRNAPKVAEGARKLWNSVGRRSSEPEPAQTPEPAGPAGLAALEGRVSALEAEAAELHAQMLASSELIKALAEQNAQLVARIERNRLHMLWWGIATAAALALSALVLVIR